MPVSGRKIPWLIIILGAVGSSILLPYTCYIFSDLYRAVHMVDLVIQDFRVRVSEGEGWANVTFTLHNPSEYTFKRVRITQKLFLNGEFLGIKFGEYRELPAKANMTVAFHFHIPPHKLKLVQEAKSQSWTATFYILFRVPIIDSTYHRSFSRKLEPQT